MNIHMTNDWTRNERGNLVKRYGPEPTPVARGSFPSPRLATDSMPLTEHVDGRYYDSKSQFRAVTKREGCIEVGNEKMAPSRPTAPKSSVRDTMERMAARL